MTTERESDPSLKQWAELYEVARNIRLLAPWNFLRETDLVTVMLPERQEPVFFSVIGGGGECYGVGVYPGYASVNGFYRMAGADADDELGFLSGFEQDCLMCYFGNREEITPKDRETLKALKLSFRGRNEWIYFRAMKPGYVPWYLDSEQAGLMTLALQNFAMAGLYIVKNQLKVDFDGGETLMRYYSPEKKIWSNKVAKMPPIPVSRPRLIVDDETLTAKLKKKKRNGLSLEFEATYVPTPIQARKEDRPYLPRIILLMDRASGLPLAHSCVDKDEPIETEIIRVLTGYIEKSGRPLSIYVRDDRAGRYIEDFCRKVGIEMIEGEGVPVVGRFIQGMMGMLDKGF